MLRQQPQGQGHYFGGHHGGHHGHGHHSHMIPPYWWYPPPYGRPPYWYPYPYWPHPYWPPYPHRNEPSVQHETIELKDYGSKPFVVNIHEATLQNNVFRRALWTGEHLQLTLMSLSPGEDIGLETHPSTDQFLRVEAGSGEVQMGSSKDRLNFKRSVKDDDVILVPAGQWHNVINTGNQPLKLYSIYAPPEHPYGTIHRTKAEAIAAEKNHSD